MTYSSHTLLPTVSYALNSNSPTISDTTTYHFILHDKCVPIYDINWNLNKHFNQSQNKKEYTNNQNKQIKKKYSQPKYLDSKTLSYDNLVDINLLDYMNNQLVINSQTPNHTLNKTPTNTLNKTPHKLVNKKQNKTHMEHMEHMEHNQLVDYNTSKLKLKNKHNYFKKNKKNNKTTYSNKIDISFVSPPYDINYNTIELLDNLHTENLSINKLNTPNTPNTATQTISQKQFDLKKSECLINHELICQEKEDLKQQMDINVDVNFNPEFVNKCYESLSNDNFNLGSLKPKHNQVNQFNQYNQFNQVNQYNQYNQSNQVNKFTKLYQYQNQYQNQNKYTGRKEYVKYDKHNIICCNCGEKGHVYKKCLYPITSIGIICLNGSKLSEYSKNKLINLEQQINFKSADLDNTDKKNKKKFENIPIENYNCQTFNKNLFNSNIFNSGNVDNIRTIKYKQNISDYSKPTQNSEYTEIKQNIVSNTLSANTESSLEYLVIRRKDSLSFSEIALAQYKLETEDDINYLLKIMYRLTQDEITFLMNVEDASDIWNKVWNSKKYNKTQSPQLNTQSPQLNTQSPQLNTQSPQSNIQSPQLNTQSPQLNTQSPQSNIQSPQSNTQSPQLNTQSPQLNIQSLQSNNLNSPVIDSLNMKPVNLTYNRINLSKTKNNNEYLKVTSKLQQIINGINVGNKFISFKTLLKGVESKWNEPEWGFPKGRRNLKESDLDCALREFQEETNIKKNQITILNITPVIEYFKGTNNINYKHIYYFAICNANINFNKKNKYQYSEISDIAWMDSNTIIDKVRDDYPDRKLMIKTISNYFQSNL